MSIQPTASWETAYPASPAAEMWLGDLSWHRKLYQESRFRWDAGDAIDIVTWHSGGQTEFTTLDDLRALQSYQDAVLDEASRARNAMASRLQVAKDELGDCWGSVLDGIGLGEAEAEAAIWFATIADADADQDSDNVRRVLQFVPFRNPLLEAFELKQLVRLYEAAGDLLEDAICDLVEELLPSRPPAVLAEAVRTRGAGALELRIATARSERGPAGDGRRLPEQRF